MKSRIDHLNSHSDQNDTGMLPKIWFERHSAAMNCHEGISALVHCFESRKAVRATH